MVIGKLPICPGVPDSTPVDGFSVRPVGSVPVTDQVTVPMAPVCVNVCEYGVPAVAAGMVAGFTVIAWQLITSVTLRLPMQLLPSLALIVIGKLPVCVGVPDSTPVDVLSVMPVGNVPVTDQVTVPMAPVCVNVCEYGVPAVPAGMVAGFTVIVWQLITRGPLRLATLPFPSLFRSVIGKLPVCVGVPDSTPVDVLSVMPVGNVPVTDHVTVPMAPVCVNVCEYGVPAVPLGMVAGFTVIVWQLITRVTLRLPTQAWQSVALATRAS